jgi:murein DD-endopeptidase MepM/ murein hydrolase activator NlpD
MCRTVIAWLFSAAIAAGFDGVALHVRGPLVPVMTNGKAALVYELEVEGLNVAPSRLEVRVNGSTTPSLVYEQAELARNTKGAVVFCWLEAVDAASVSSLQHELFYRSGKEARSVRDEPVPIDQGRIITLKPPLGEGEWWAAIGPSNAGDHRRARVRVNGSDAPFAQRYAIDWARLCDGRMYANRGSANTDFCGYGQDVLAVADARVAAVKDGIVENKPGENSRAVKVTLETLLGNHIVLDLGDHLYAVYAHLQPGSLRVKAGDRVQAGQAIARLGNSGNSDAPHLHFHIAQAETVEAVESVQSRPYPYVFESFDMLGRYTGRGAMKPAEAQSRTLELPPDGGVVRFKQ